VKHIKEYQVGDHILIVDQTNLEQYWRFIYDRHLIWHKRFILQEPAPWTEDPILRDYKFTNVYRELDKGTIYLLDNIVHVKKYDVARLWSMIIYRMFNRISMMEAIGFQGFSVEHMDTMFNKLRELQKTQSIYTDAHMVCAYANIPGEDKLARIEHMMRQSFPRVFPLLKIIKEAPNLETIFNAIESNIDGYGPFLSYELSVDITYDRGLTGLDEDHWANAGPGAMRGADAILIDRPKKFSYLDWMIWLRDTQDQHFSELGLDFASISYKSPMNKRTGRMTLRNIEHCLCEYFKYHKAFTNTGRPRNKFNPVSTDPEDMARLRG
jgi:hypothetical protein